MRCDERWFDQVESAGVLGEKVCLFFGLSNFSAKFISKLDTFADPKDRGFQDRPPAFSYLVENKGKALKVKGFTIAFF